MELLDVLDEEGNLTGNKEDKDIIHEKGLWHREVCALIRNRKGEYLIQKREIREELGIEVALEELTPLSTFKEAFENETTTNNNYTRYYFYETNRKIEDYTICLEELSELKYITIEEMEEAVEKKDENCSYARRDEMKEVIKLLKNIN